MINFFDFLAIVAVTIVLSSGSKTKRSGTIVLVIAALGSASIVGKVVYDNFLHPRVWDFYCFWVYGQAAVHMHRVYDPAALEVVARSIPFSHDYTPALAREFLIENVQTGMLYPPPSVLMFYPLGLFKNMHFASLLWTSLNVVGLIGIALLLWRKVYASLGITGAIAAFVVATAFSPLVVSLEIEQTTIAALLFTLLFVLEPNKTRQGVWLALAIVAKPVVVPLALLMILHKNYAALRSFVLSTLTLTALSTVALGVSSVVSYVTHNPVMRVPGTLLREDAYVSLWSVAFRAMNDHATHYGFLRYPGLIALSALMMSISLWICWKVKDDLVLCAALCVSAALLVYPGTLHFYSVLLLLPMLSFWLRRREIRHGSVLCAAFWCAVAALVTYKWGMPSAFYAFALSWACMLTLGIHTAYGIRAATRFHFSEQTA